MLFGFNIKKLIITAFSSIDRPYFKAGMFGLVKLNQIFFEITATD